MISPADIAWIEGGRIPGTDAAAFRHTDPDRAAVPLVVAIPHAGRNYSDALRAKLRAPARLPIELEDRLIDQVAIPAALAVGATVIVADAPRAVIDLNRSPDDLDWSMIEGAALSSPTGDDTRRARHGLGLIPRRIAGQGELWRARFSQAELSEKLISVHTPYHTSLHDLLSAVCRRWGAATLVDVHSMPPLQQTHGTASAGLVVGDRYGSACEPRFSAGAMREASELGVAVALNRPYSGGYVLDRHGRPAKGRNAIQLEICRSLYLDEGLRSLSDRAATVTNQLSHLFAAMAELTLKPQEWDGLRQAAE